MTTVPLQYPIEVDGEAPITSVTLGRLKAKHMRAITAAKDDVSRTLEMIAASSGLPLSAVEEMDAEDMTTVAEAIAGFLPKPATEPPPTVGAA